MTMRELWWAARGAWDHTTGLMSWIAAKFVGQHVDPDSLNPYRAQVTVKRKPSPAFWDAVEAALKGS